MKGFPDKPLDEKGIDLFDVSVYTDSLAEFIINCDTPMTIAIQGDWGSGKTSMMRLIKSKLGEDAYTVWFNTWQYSQFNLGDHLAISLMNKMLKDLGSKSEEIKQLINMFWGFGKKLLSTAVKNASGGIIEVETDKAKSDEDIVEKIIELKDKIQNVINETIKNAPNNRIIVFVDDLDRLEPEKAVGMLEVMKIFLDCENCVFLLAVDYNVVSQGIRKKFGDSVSDEKGKSFFDKIIQLPFKMPVSLYNLDKYINSALKSMGINADQDEIIKYKNLIIKSISQNPRSMKRLFNSFDLIRTVVSKNKNAEKMNKDTQRILFAVLCMQMAYEQLYEYFLTNRNEFDKEFFIKESKESLAEAVYQNETKPDDRNVTRIFDFYEAFIDAIQLDNDKDLSETEIKYLQEILAFSAITSRHNISDVDVKGDERRYLCRNIVKGVYSEGPYPSLSEI